MMESKGTTQDEKESKHPWLIKTSDAVHVKMQFRIRIANSLSPQVHFSRLPSAGFLLSPVLTKSQTPLTCYLSH